MNRMDGSNQLNPAMLTLAREARGYSQAELAETLGISQSKVSKAEAGFLNLSDEELHRLARLLDFPRSFFAWSESAGGIPVHEVFHRKRHGVPAKALTMIYQLMNYRRLQVMRLCRSASIDADGFQHIDPDEHNGDVEAIARIIRARWGLPAGPMVNVTEAIEDAGGIVIHHDFPTRQVDAISTWTPSIPPLFFVNANAPGDRCRFTLAHELGHCVMHRTIGPDAEAEADRFAAEFLLPAKDIRPQLRDLNVQKLAGLKQYWRVSMAAILKRASDLETITPRQARSLWMRLSQLGYRKHEPVEIPLERPTLFRELIDFHRDELRYKVVDLVEWLGDNHIDETGHPPGTGLRIAR